ncbi:SGNH/GDSL hydrolase family protein [Bacillus sp. FSL K6-3431]|uniref:SGNH/GDSL hydrolase family protein n=1 Tax=Bacillus sp. FSL K6-3431 TaxID=2921500 RepID=UPI0030F93C39
MRTALTYLAIIACGIFLVSGYLYWKEQTNNAVGTNEKAGPVVSNKESDEKKTTKTSADPNLLLMTGNWPEKAQETFEEAIDVGRTYKVAIVGSAALGKDNNGWSDMLKEELVAIYGKNNLEISIFEYPVRSDQFIAEGYDEEVAAYKPDLILFEPFNLNDNGNLGTSENHENIMSVIKTLEKANEKAVVILQPPHPVVSTIYPSQVDELKDFAEEQELVYLDHWPNWPDTDDETLNDYLMDPASAPNEKGHELWFKFLKEYFISDK